MRECQSALPHFYKLYLMKLYNSIDLQLYSVLFYTREELIVMVIRENYLAKIRPFIGRTSSRY